MTLHFEGTVEEYTRLCQPSPLTARLDDIAAKLELLLSKENQMDDQIKALAKKLDDATTAVAQRLQTLIDKANQAGTLAAAEISQFLQPEVDHLTALAADPGNPVPTAP